MGWQHPIKTKGDTANLVLDASRNFLGIMNNLYFSFFLINNSFLITYQKKKLIVNYYVVC